MRAVKEGRVDTDAEAAIDALGGADQLEAEAELSGVLEVVGGEVLDALVWDLGEAHRRVERQPRQDRHLGGGVLAGDVVGRVGLGVAKRLGLGQRVSVLGAGLGHPAQDEVRGAVDDPVQTLDMRAGQRLLQDPHNGDDAADRGLEAQLHAVLARDRPQLLAVLGQQLLVGGDDVLAGGHRAHHVLACRLQPAHQLHHQVGVVEDVVEVAFAAAQDAGDLGTQAGDVGDVVGALRDEVGERAADGAAAEQADAERSDIRSPAPCQPHLAQGCLGHLRRPSESGPRSSRGARPRVPSHRRRRRSAAGADRCSCWPSRGRRRR